MNPWADDPVEADTFGDIFDRLVLLAAGLHAAAKIVDPLPQAERDEFEAARSRLVDELDSRRGASPVTFVQFARAFGHVDERSLAEIYSRMSPDDGLRDEATKWLRRVGIDVPPTAGRGPVRPA